MIEWLRFVLILSVTVARRYAAGDRPLVQHDSRLDPLSIEMDCARQGARDVPRPPAVNPSRLRRALRRSPGYLARRALESARYRTRRPWAYVYPRLLTERALLRSLGAPGIDALWDELARQPFFISAADRETRTARFVAGISGEPRRARAGGRGGPASRVRSARLGPAPLGTPLPWHTDFKTGREWPLALLPRHRIQRARSAHRRQGAVGAQPLPALHAPRPGVLADRRRALRRRSSSPRSTTGSPPTRLSYGVNWACAMDVALRAVSWIWGFHFFARRRRPAAIARSAARFLRALFLHGEFVVNASREGRRQRQSLPVRRRRPRLSRLLLPARPTARRRWLALGRAIVEQEDLRADDARRRGLRAVHRVSPARARSVSHELRAAAQLRRGPCRRRAGSGSSACASSSQAYTKPDGRAPLIGDADDGRIQILGTQAIDDHRYLLSSARRAVRPRRISRRRPGSCWEETFWLLGADAPRRFGAPAGRRRRPDRRRFPTAASTCCAPPTTHLVVDCGERRHARPRRPRPQRHPELRALPERLQRRHRLRRVPLHGVARMAEPVSQHGLSQHGAGGRRRAEPVLGPDALWQLHVRREAGRRGAERRRAGRLLSRRPLRLRAARATRLARHGSASSTRRVPRVLVRDRAGREPASHALTWRFHLDPAVTRRAATAATSGFVTAAASVWLLPDDAAAGVRALGRGRLGFAELRREGADDGARLESRRRVCRPTPRICLPMSLLASGTTRRLRSAAPFVGMLKWL